MSLTSNKAILRTTSIFRIYAEAKIEDDRSLKIGSKYKRGTRDLLKGLTHAEEKALLPKLIGIDPNSQNWEEKVQNFYANLTINVPANPSEHLLLDISMTDKVVEIDGEKVRIPKYPIEYIQYKQALVDSSVAKTKADRDNIGMFQFILEDESENKNKKVRKNEIDNQLSITYLKLVTEENGMFKQADKLNYVIRLYGYNPIELSSDDKKIFLSDKKNEAIKFCLDNEVEYTECEFYKIVSDPNLKDKAEILAFVEHGILVREGESFADADDQKLVLGNSLEEAVKYMLNPVNGNQINKYRFKYNERSK
jgi:hypothetical protein